MGEKAKLESGIFEVKFEYYSKMDEYTALLSDIPKLGEFNAYNRQKKTGKE